MRPALPVAAVVGVFGVSFGVLARAAGMGAPAAATMSATTFGGSAQFAAISVLGAGGSAAAAILAALLLNSRYGPIGLSVAPALRGRFALRLVQSQLVVDESWALANRGGGVFDRAVLLGAGACLWAAWVGGTLAGVIGGDFVGDPADFGLDAAFPALFLALLAPQLRHRRAILAAALGATIAVSLVPLTEPGVPIVAASLGCLAGWKRR